MGRIERIQRSRCVCGWPNSASCSGAPLRGATHSHLNLLGAIDESRRPLEDPGTDGLDKVRARISYRASLLRRHRETHRKGQVEGGQEDREGELEGRKQVLWEQVGVAMSF